MKELWNVGEVTKNTRTIAKSRFNLLIGDCDYYEGKLRPNYQSDAYLPCFLLKKGVNAD